MFNLTVIEPFNGYQKGDLITDQALIKVILESENSGHVIKVPAQTGAQ